MNSTTVNNVAAIVAAVGVAEEPVVGALLQSRRRSCTMKSGGRGVDSPSMGKGVGTLADSNRIGSTRGVNDCLIEEHNSTMDESAVAEGATTLEDVDNISKARARRASEGAHLSKNESKRSNGELRCEKCGKGYKHSSCLTKHLLVYLAKHLFYTLEIFPSSLRGSISSIVHFWGPRPHGSYEQPH